LCEWDVVPSAFAFIITGLSHSSTNYSFTD
jgi:hypothetical protein